MKKIIIIITLLIFNAKSFSQTNLFAHPEFDEIAKSHKIIAILPFKTTIKLRPKQMKETSSEDLARMEVQEGESIQAAMYSWFLKRKKQGKLKVDVQEPSRTAALLKKNNITPANMVEFTKDKIAKILEVDAIISGTLETDKPMSEGASIAVGLLVGVWGSTNSAVVNISVHNATDGELLWNYNKKVRGSVGSSNSDLINKLMRKTSRRLSYTKMK